MDLDTTADELYGVPVAEFTAVRDQAVRAAREAGDRELADAVKSLRRPTVAAWLANQLVRRHHDEVVALVDLGVALRQAQEALAARELRDLSSQRREAIASLLRQAKQIAADAGQTVGEAALREVGASLDAGSADPESGALLVQGRLEKSLSYSGFGPGTTAGAPPNRPRLTVVRDTPRTSTSGSASRSSSRLKSERVAAERAVSDAQANASATKRNERAAATAVVDAERDLDAADAALSALEDQVREARAAVAQAKRGVTAAQRAHGAAERLVETDTAELARLRRALDELDD